MNTRFISGFNTKIVAVLVLLIVLFGGGRALALGAAANAMCNPWFAQCGCNQVPCKGGCCGGKNTNKCPVGICVDKTNDGTTLGICSAANKCEGVTGSGLGGAQEALGAFKQIFDLVKGMAGGGGGGGAEMPNYGTSSANVCTNYYQVTVPSSDPCAIYNPSGVLDAANTGSSGISGTLLDALGGSGGSATPPTSVSGQLNATLQNTPPATQGTPTTNTNTPTNTNANPTNTSTLKPAAQGLSGDVRIGTAGATVIANLRQGLSEVAGFFGGSTGGASQALSAAGRICATRPWSGSFASNLIPSSFFDGLCEWRGYQAGMPIPTNTPSAPNTVIVPAQAIQRPVTGMQQPPVADVPPEVDIWAEPASVRLGTRTYIFWNTRGVSSCKESGPSFSHASLSGGASTVPISGATTFTIECLTRDNTTITDSVSVQIAI